MEKVTLEHIAPYLPYGLKILHTEMEMEGYYTQVVSLSTAGEECLTFSDHKFGASDYDYEPQSSPEVKPILRTMDLTKTIIVEGKEIIAYHELCKIACNIQELSEDVSYNENNRQLEVIGKRGYKLIFAFDSSDNSFIIMSNGVTKCVSNQLSLFQWLFKYKFDVFGLIEKGLAIDVNTLETNPYN